MFSREFSLPAKVLILCLWLIAQPSWGESGVTEGATAVETAAEGDAKFDLEIRVDESEDEVAAKVLRKLTEKGIIDSKDVIFEKSAPSPKKSSREREGFNENILVPIVAVIVIFGMPVFIVALVGWQNYRKQKLFHDSVNRLIERGMDIPPALYEQFDGKTKSDSNLNKGVRQVALGLGLMIFLAAVSGEDVATLGVIPLLLGVANLLIYKLDTRSNDPGTR